MSVLAQSAKPLSIGSIPIAASITLSSRSFKVVAFRATPAEDLAALEAAYKIEKDEKLKC